MMIYTLWYFNNDQYETSKYMQMIERNRVLEIEFTSSNESYGSEADNIELDVIISTPNKQDVKIPAYWAGGLIWRVRISSEILGEHSFSTICSDSTNLGLNNRKGTFTVIEYQGNNVLYQNGKLQVNPEKKFLQHRNGKPFFWLGDTWWMGFTKRLQWPVEFQQLTSDRVQKGFTLIQIVAGLYPDMPPFDERGANEAGYPWDGPQFQHINPSYFDLVDRRVQYLVDAGLIPCIVGCWGYFLRRMGISALKKHWRYIIARYGAYPVVWCIAGEAMMKYYLDQNPTKQHRMQLLQDWSEIAKYIRKQDGFKNPITIHPTNYGHEQLSQPELLDINMLQTGHANPRDQLMVVLNTVQMINKAIKVKIPVVVGEVNYEGIFETNHQEIQRCLFWASILSGAKGFTYGANGIWQLNRKERPFGPSPYGNNWGETPWDEAYRFLGSTHVGVGKEILLNEDWTQIESHHEWVKGDFIYAAKLGETKRIFYKLIPGRFEIMKLKKGVKYHPTWINPLNGKRYELEPFISSKKGSWQAPNPPLSHDWVLLLEEIKN